MMDDRGTDEDLNETLDMHLTLLQVDCVLCNSVPVHHCVPHKNVKRSES